MIYMLKPLLSVLLNGCVLLGKLLLKNWPASTRLPAHPSAHQQPLLGPPCRYWSAAVSH